MSVQRFWPLERGCIITSGYGFREYDNAVHRGIDFGWPNGSGGKVVYAVQAGVVQYSGAADGYGGPDPAGWLVIDSDDTQGGGCFEYGHIVRDSNMRVGTQVAAGQRIGVVNPNRATNAGVDPHVHVSYWPRAYGGPEGKQDWRRLLDAAAYPGAATPKPAPQPEGGGTVATKPAYTETVRLSNAGSSRRGAAVRNLLLHTEEGNSSAANLAAYCSNPANNASYHYIVRDGVVYSIVDTDLASWSVLDANPYTINLCFAGSRASFTREQWLARRNDIRIAAWLLVQDAKKYRVATDVIAPPYKVRNGLSDHKYVTQALGIGSHTDVGNNFPWDVFAADVREFTTGAPAVPAPPPVNAINELAKKTPWLGARIDAAEKATPDGKGRYVAFAAGHVYWTPGTGAVAIPTALFQAWGELGWERGPLGYPTVPHTQLPGGLVQAFERGVLYRQDGAEHGYYVHGRIGARWARVGYENGPLGWPVSNEVPLADGAVRQDFQRGAMYWSPDGVTVAVDGADTVTHPQNH